MKTPDELARWAEENGAKIRAWERGEVGPGWFWLIQSSPYSYCVQTKERLAVVGFFSPDPEPVLLWLNNWLQRPQQRLARRLERIADEQIRDDQCA